MSEVRIAAEQRTEFGKGAARRIRRDAKVPAVLYGHGSEPRHISLPGHALMRALRTPNVLLNLDLEGGSQLALPKDVQRDPVKGSLEHVDLLLVRSGEKVVVEVPVLVTGDAAADTLVVVDMQLLSVETEATHIPASLEVSIEGLGAGSQIHAGQVPLPRGTTLAADPDLLVVNVTAAQTAEQVEAELADAEAEAGIVHEEKDADAEVASADAGDAALAAPDADASE